jgi:Cu2+-exporting ATPase
VWAAGSGFDAADFARTLQRFNYVLGPAGAEDAVKAAAGRAGEPEGRALARRVGLCAAFAMNVMLFTLPAYFGLATGERFARLFETLAMAFATLSLLAGGGFFLGRAWRALRERMVHLDLPIALGIVGAYAGSVYGWATANPENQYFDFVSGFILLMLVGRWAQVAAVERNQRRLLRSQPVAERVRVWRGEGWIEAAPESIAAGERITVAGGQLVPVEGVLAASAADEAAVSAEFNLAWITGEAESRRFEAGRRVPAGARFLGPGTVELRVAAPWAGSLLAQLVAPVQAARKRELLLERVIQIYLVAILTTAAAAGVGWWLATGDAAHTGAVVISVLVVSCPCALGLAFPLAEEWASVALRRRGVFVRAADVWTRLGGIKRVVFDKTGTLTLETPALRNPEGLDALDDETRAALFALVRDNPHPAGRALHEAMLLRGEREALAGVVEETVGRGVRLKEWTLGRPDWAADPAAGDGQAAGEAVLARAGRVVAKFAFIDAVRTDAAAEVRALRERGLAVAILSGDEQAKVVRLAAAIGVGEADALGGLSPQEKAAWVEAHEPAATLMLGDGANDSLAFDRAGCRGTPVLHRGVLTEKADFYYLGRGVGGVRLLLEVDAMRRRTQLALLIFMIAYNLAAVGLAVAGLMNPLFAAVLMPLSSLATLAIVAMGMRRAGG